LTAVQQVLLGRVNQEENVLNMQLTWGKLLISAKRILKKKLTEKESLGRPRRWKDNTCIIGI
jgi:hypothetical protein